MIKKQMLVTGIVGVIVLMSLSTLLSVVRLQTASEIIKEIVLLDDEQTLIIKSDNKQ